MADFEDFCSPRSVSLGLLECTPNEDLLNHTGRLLHRQFAAGELDLDCRSPLGVRIYMIGSNLEATRFSGVDTRRVQISVYLISSLLCWLAAVVMMARFNSAGADIAQSYLLITILAAILGGVDPYGGFGRVIGLFLALCILQVVASGFNLMGLSPHLALASWGAVLLLVMAAKRLAQAIRAR